MASSSENNNSNSNQIVPTTMASSMGSTANIPKLTSTTYQSWLEMVSIYLQLKGWSKALSSEGVDEIMDLQCKLVLLETMDESHRSQVRGCAKSKDIIDRMRLVYADNSAANVYRLLHRYYRYQKLESDTISEHLGKMDEMRRGLADLGEKQSDTLYQVTLIGSLPSEYQSLMETWELTHPDMRTNAVLVARLLKREEDVKGQMGGVAMAAGKLSKDWNSMTIQERKKISRCKECQQKGHWYAECPSRQGKSGSDSQKTQAANILFNLGNIGPELKYQWIADSGATQHMCNNQDWFTKLTFHAVPRTATVGDGNKVIELGYGEILINRTVKGVQQEGTLVNVAFIPSLASNLFSISAAAKQGITASFNQAECGLYKEGELVMKGMLWKDGLYLLEIKATVPKKALIVRTEPTLDYLHKAMGHASYDKIRQLAKSELVKLKSPGEETHCADCPAGKARRAVHPESTSTRASQVGERVHVDLATIPNKDKIDYCYYLICKDEASEYSFLYMLQSKAQMAEVFRRLIVDFEYGSGRPILSIHSDNGSEFKNRELEFLFLKERILHTTSAAYTPQQNGMAEREIQTITNMARSMLVAAKLGPKLIPEALKTACYLKNRLPTTRDEMTPFERYTGRKPELGHLFIFGQQVQVIEIANRLTKFEPRTMNGYVVGYTNRLNTYRVYVIKLGRTIETCEVIFAPHREEAIGTSNRTDVRVQVDGILSDKVELVAQHVESELEPNFVRQGGEETRAAAQHHLSGGMQQSTPNQLARSREAPPVPPRKFITGSALQEYFDDFLLRSVTGSENSNETADETADETVGDGPPHLEQQEVPSNSSADPPVLQRQAVVGLDAETDEPQLRIDTQDQEDNTVIEQIPPPLLSPNETGTSVGSEITLTDPPALEQKCLLVDTRAERDIPESYREALESPEREEWLDAIRAELSAHDKNNTWTLADKRESHNLLSTKWVFTKKRDAQGRVERYKARLVARGYQQRPGWDYMETFAPVAGQNTIRTFFALCAEKKLEMLQFDVSTAFLNGILKEDVYVSIPEGITRKDGKCLKLIKSLYGLKQAPHEWNCMLRSVLEKLTFTPTVTDPCLFQSSERDALVIVYVDDGIVAAKDEQVCRGVIKDLNKHFSTKELSGDQFLGMEVYRGTEGIRLSQTCYTNRVLERFGMKEASKLSAPTIDIKSLIAFEGSPKTKAPYGNAIGCLQYLANWTRPDTLFSVNFLARFTHDPREIHWSAVKRVMGYLVGTNDYAIHFPGDSSGLVAYSDADFANDTSDRKSVSGVLTLLHGGPVIFSSRKQSCIAQSSTEAEYVAANEAVRGIIWLDQLLAELKIDIRKPVLRIDNRPAIKQIESDQTLARAKHVEIKFHLIRDHHRKDLFKLEHVATEHQSADMLTKSLDSKRLATLAKNNSIGRKSSMAVRSRASSPVKLGLPAKLAVAVMCCLALGAMTDGFRFEKVDPLLWLPAKEYRVELGLKQVQLDLVTMDPCQIIGRANWDSAMDVKRTAYEGLIEQCTETYTQKLVPTFLELTKCLPQSRGNRRHKRVVDPVSLTLVLGTMVVLAVGAVTATAIKYLDPNSDYNRLAKLERRDAARKHEIEVLESRIIELEVDRNTTADVLTGVNGRVELVRKGVGHLATLMPAVSWASAEMRLAIHQEILDLKTMVKACKQERLATKEAHRIYRLEEIADADDKDTFIESMELVNNRTIAVRFNLLTTSMDTQVYAIRGISHFVNETFEPVLMKYVGPSHALFNETNQCSKGLHNPEKRIYNSCSTKQQKDPRLSDWQPVTDPEEVLQLSKPSVYKTDTESIIYCLYSHIVINGIKVSCPPYAFRLPITIAFEILDHAHHVETIRVAAAERGVTYVTPHLSNGTSEDYEREAKLTKGLYKQHKETIKAGRLSFEKGTLTIPLDIKIIASVISFVGGFLTILTFISRCILTRESPHEHQEQINLFTQLPAPPVVPVRQPEIYSQLLVPPMGPLPPTPAQEPSARPGRSIYDRIVRQADTLRVYPNINNPFIEHRTN